MKIIIEHFGGERPQFNVKLASADGKEPFLTIKGCRLVSGRDGQFVSWPATKNEKTGKYWSHVWGSDAFASAVIAEALKAAPPEPDKRTLSERKARKVDDDSDIPF